MSSGVKETDGLIEAQETEERNLMRSILSQYEIIKVVRLTGGRKYLHCYNLSSKNEVVIRTILCKNALLIQKI